jgi:proteasome lid subunit RPN8/RPN11
MRSWIAGRRRGRRRRPADADPLAVVRVATEGVPHPRSLGRRDVDFAFDRVFVPSLIVDHTELILRQAGVAGHEGFVVWAGTLANGHAQVSTVVVPASETTAVHGQISPETTARVLDALDARDLVPVLQVHSHPRRAFLSETDAIRPIVAAPGFVSVVIRHFGFVDLVDVAQWSAHEFLGNSRWRELDPDERARRFIVDDSIIRVD